MNQQCKVCGEPAAGYHFGAFTCEGCKSFFGRTYNNASNIAECKNGGRCVINKKNRTSCKDCRLRKCVKVGMSKSSSRYGRRSNWFKIHCLLQEQSNSQNIISSGNIPSFAPNFLPNLIPQPQMRQDGIVYCKDRKNLTPPSPEDLSQLLQVAMMRQERDQQQSPRSDDCLESRRRMYLSLHKSRNYNPSVNSPPPRKSASPSFDRRASPTISMNMMNVARSLPTQEYVLQEVERAERYKRYADTISESSSVADGSNDGDRLHDIESRSNPEPNYSKNSPTLPEQESSSRKTINTTLTLTASYYQRGVNQCNLASKYPPADLVTPATSNNTLAGGDLLRDSPSPGGLAIEQNEPIDLSVRPSKILLLRKQSSEDNSDETDEEKSNCNDSSKEEETAPEETPPLDLTLTVKRSAEVL